MNRKEFLRLGALGFAALPLLSLSQTQPPEGPEFDVAIVGAGLSGLSAAALLSRSGLRVVVLEAQDRVGGRTWSQPIGRDSFIDIGGQWIGKGHDSMYRLAREAGIATFPTYTTGRHTWQQEGRMKRYKGENPPVGLLGLLRLAKGGRKFDKLTQQVDPLRPWDMENAAQLDRISLGDWLDENIRDEKSARIFKRIAEGELCTSTHRISMLQALSSARATGSFQQAESTEGGALQDRLQGGAQGICNFLHGQIRSAVRLNCPVSFVEQSGDGLRLGNRDYALRARKAIITAPLSVVRKIDFSPGLPPAKRSLIESMEMGEVVKCHAVYASPFWREAGLSGQSFSVEGTVELSVDNSAYGSSEGILASLIHADRAELMMGMGPEERKQLVLAAYADWFGPRALEPIGYHDYSFTDNPWIGGAYTGFFGEGVFSENGSQIAKPTGHVHWAGTETSAYFKGFMEGAVLSGERAAAEVIGALR